MGMNMVEMAKNIDIGGETPKIDLTTVKLSGSLQKGHFLRNCFWQLQGEINHFLPDVCMRYIPNHINVTQDWLIRRDMRRISRDGRR